MFGCFTNTALAFNKTNKTIRSPGDLRAPRSSAAAAGSQSSVSVCRAKAPSCHGPCRGRETDTGCASPSRTHKRETTNVCVTSTHNAKTSCHYLTFLRLYSCYDGKPEAGRVSRKPCCKWSTAPRGPPYGGGACRAAAARPLAHTRPTGDPRPTGAPADRTAQAAAPRRRAVAPGRGRTRRCSVAQRYCAAGGGK